MIHCHFCNSLESNMFLNFPFWSLNYQQVLSAVRDKMIDDFFFFFFDSSVHESVQHQYSQCVDVYFSNYLHSWFVKKKNMIYRF